MGNAVLVAVQESFEQLLKEVSSHTLIENAIDPQQFQEVDFS